jgi:hypothetical protein
MRDLGMNPQEIKVKCEIIRYDVLGVTRKNIPKQFISDEDGERWQKAFYKLQAIVSFHAKVDVELQTGGTYVDENFNTFMAITPHEIRNVTLEVDTFKIPTTLLYYACTFAE